ncbi:MAG TPA: formyl transferase [Gammaproteobacteria bacterium]|nr:formyl transferase [Gammaproteobacteria bacterium]
MNKPLRLMVLCGQSPRHLYVANRLCAAGEVVAIVHEEGRELGLKTFLRKLRPRVLLPKIWRWLRDRPRYANSNEASFFFPDGAPHLDRPELVRRCPHINHPDVVRWLAELEPDLVCVFGTSLIRGELLRGGELGIVNLHGGLSPEYRGADCTFWALHNGEPDKVGCTLHYINAGIDTGSLIAHVCPAVHPDDDELTLFWRAVRDSADIYEELVRRLAAGERFGVAQPGKGRLYQVKDRGLRHERALRARLAAGLLANCRLPPRVTWFTKSTS